MTITLNTPQRTTVTQSDQQRLGRMIDSLRANQRTVQDPLDSYLGALEGRLGNAAVVTPDSVSSDVVTMNSHVRLCDLDTGAGQVVTLVYDGDADALGPGISVLSPLGAAILGSRVGDVIEWHSHRGPRRLRIERIVFQPEAAGKLEL